ncbi:YdcF family protein [Candidatus Parcubacteria bacterium]|nr:YdcF family protein [Patescibacteria group bacterium]MCG2693734.1 YdcF family protein [Candidatus Parcubacteria bacterium]
MKWVGWKKMIILTGIGIFGLFFILTILIYKYSYIDDKQKADAIVVLGASQWDGKPSPVFRARLDHAHELYNEKYAPLIILTGGIGDGEKFSESYVGTIYLSNRGIHEKDILIEEKGRTSWQSLKNVAEIMREREIDSIILVSDGFHLMRLQKMANDLGIRNFISAAKESPVSKNKFIKFKYVVREAFVFLMYILFKI